MEMTLDEFLREVDTWKQPVSDRMAKLTPAERAQADREALDWLEQTLGRRLEEVSGEDVVRGLPRLAGRS